MATAGEKMDYGSTASTTKRYWRCRCCSGLPPARRSEFTESPRDPRALVDALNRLLEDEMLRNKMGEAGYARAKSEFTLERMWEGMLNVYRSLNVEQGTENSE